MNDQLQMLPAYFQLMNMNGAAHVYHEAVRSGLLDALQPEPATLSELSVRGGSHERATRLMLDVLETLQLVKATGERWSLTLLAQMLLSGSYRELGDLYWSHLPAFLKYGQPLVKMDDAAKSETYYQTQAAALAWMLGPTAELAAESLHTEIGSAAEILDLGAGSAIWSLSLARRADNRCVTAVDWPAVLEVATDYARQFELSDRFQTLVGDFHKLELPASKYDLAILANVTHLQTPAANIALFRRIHAALRPDARLAIIDVFPGLSDGDLNRTLYSLGLALRTEHGRVYSVEELERMLMEAGFETPRLANLHTPPYIMGILVASRSA
jgi:ubiquinone/menaquinone biosynthesis C-methylase UbiE